MAANIRIYLSMHKFAVVYEESNLKNWFSQILWLQDSLSFKEEELGIFSFF